ncbi:hypothetical protein ACFCYX_07320 [Streptomyces populi]|uniref:hypothetical protein n=1 Tax=Streptomyces populi TaxID=2058924 RepID=UPI0013A6F5AC|nr:hypothetical protein [Streptomyces populi]
MTSTSTEVEPAPVFVDETGLRGRRLRGFGWLVGVICTGCVVAMVSGLVGTQSQAPALTVPGSANTTPPSQYLNAPLPAAPGKSATATSGATAPVTGTTGSGTAGTGTTTSVTGATGSGSAAGSGTAGSGTTTSVTGATGSGTAGSGTSTSVTGTTGAGTAASNSVTATEPATAQ